MRKRIMASQNGDRALPRLVNGWLAWDGLTQIRHGVTVQTPAGWNVAQPDADNRDNTIAVHHRWPGIGLDAGYKTGTVVLYQEGVRFPAGEYGLRVELLNHAQPAGAYDASWQVAVISPHSRAISNEWWVDGEKGERSLYAVVRVVQGFVGALELRYRVRYASVQGEMQVRRVRFTDEIPARADFRLVIGVGGESASGVTLDADDYADVMRTLKQMRLMQSRLRSLLVTGAGDGVASTGVEAANTD